MNHILNRNLLFKPIKWQIRSSKSFVLTEPKRHSSIDEKHLKQINTAIPIYETRFRMGYSPLYWKIKDYAYDRVYSVTYPHELKRAKNCCHGLLADILTSFFFPFTKRVEHFVTLTEMIAFYFLTDDFIGVENSQKGIEDLINTVCGNKTPEKPNELIIHGITEKVRSFYTETQYNRFIAEIRANLLDVLKEVMCTKQINSFDDAIKFRESTGAIKPYLALIPYSVHIDVTEFTGHQILTRMESLIARHVILINDCYSMKREVSAGERMPYNSLRFLDNETNDLELAVKRSFALIDAYEDEYLGHKLRLEKQFPDKIDLHKYMECMEYFAGGNIMWSLFCPRYNDYNKYPLKEFVLKNRFSELADETERNKVLMH